MCNQLTVVFLKVRKYARNGVINGVCGPVADIRQICSLDRANDLLHEILFHSCHFMEQAQFIGVRDPYVGVFMGSCAVCNDERTLVSRVD